MLPDERMVYRLGSLYLTTKRVVLVTPQGVRSAFVSDIDAVGTFTEKPSLWAALLAAAPALAGAFLLWALGPGPDGEGDWLRALDPWIPAAVAFSVSLALAVRFLLKRSRTLFVAVRGRPLITLRTEMWGTIRSPGMETFIDAFFKVKDLTSGQNSRGDGS